jgi:hypothetical protein
VCASAVLAVCASAAVAAAPPATSTGQATSVTLNTASLNGTVNPQGQDTNYYFQYGTSTAYGNQTATTDAGPGTAAVNASAAISSLAPATTYHYRLVATNASGTTLGADRSFATNSRPPIAVTGKAKAVTYRWATVTGGINPRGQATSFFFQYGTTTAYGQQTPTRSAGAGAAWLGVYNVIASLAPDTTYHYRLVATSPSATTVGNDASFTTAGSPAALTVAASSATITFGQVTALSGKVAPLIRARVIVRLQSAPSLGGPWVTLRRTTRADTKTGAYSFTGLTPSSNTYYRTFAEGAVSPPVQVLVRFRVGVLVRKHVAQGSLVRFHGRVAPAHRGLRVWIEQLGRNGRWHIIERARLHGLKPNFSLYSVRVSIEQSGLYRVVVKHDRDHAQGFSKIVRIHVR